MGYVLLIIAHNHCNSLSFNASINNFVCFSEIKINDTVVKAQDELTCSLGECVSVGIGICNALEHPLSDLMLSINFYQDHHNGVNNYQLETRLSIAGANKIMLPAVSYFIDKKKNLNNILYCSDNFVSFSSYRNMEEFITNAV